VDFDSNLTAIDSKMTAKQKKSKITSKQKFQILSTFQILEVTGRNPSPRLQIRGLQVRILPGLPVFILNSPLLFFLISLQKASFLGKYSRTKLCSAFDF